MTSESLNIGKVDSLIGACQCWDLHIRWLYIYVLWKYFCNPKLVFFSHERHGVWKSASRFIVSLNSNTAAVNVLLKCCKTWQPRIGISIFLLNLQAYKLLSQSARELDYLSRHICPILGQSSGSADSTPEVLNSHRHKNHALIMNEL